MIRDMFGEAEAEKLSYLYPLTEGKKQPALEEKKDFLEAVAKVYHYALVSRKDGLFGVEEEMYSDTELTQAQNPLFKCIYLFLNYLWEISDLDSIKEAMENRLWLSGCEGLYALGYYLISMVTLSYMCSRTGFFVKQQILSATPNHLYDEVAGVLENVEKGMIKEHK